MSDHEPSQPAAVWPPQSLVEEAQRTWEAVTNKVITEDEARSVVLGIANLFDVVGVDRLAQPEDKA